PPYDRLDFEVPVFDAGDVNARVWVRIREVEQSLGLIDQILRGLPAGAIRVAIDPPGEVREGLRMAEALRGGVLSLVRLAARCVTCGNSRGVNGRCWKPRLRAISLQTSHCATNRSTARIPVTIFRITACAGFYTTAWCAAP